MRETVLIVIALKGFQDVELDGTIQGLEAQGYTYELCGKEIESRCVGKFGGIRATTIAMRDANPENYDLIALIGGPGARVLSEDQEALDLVRRFYAAKKIIGAICIAPLIVCSSGVMKGKRMTIFDSKGGKGPEVKLVKDLGSVFVEEMPVVVDLPFVTGNGPNAASEFGRTLAMVSL